VVGGTQLRGACRTAHPHNFVKASILQFQIIELHIICVIMVRAQGATLITFGNRGQARRIQKPAQRVVMPYHALCAGERVRL